MVLRFIYIVRNLILKGQHTLCVQIARPGDKVLLVGVLPGQLVANQVTAIIEVFSLNQIVIADSLPAAGLYHADFTPLPGGHDVHTNAGKGCAAAT